MSNVREKFLEAGVTEEQLAVMGHAMLDWADDSDGVFAFIRYEVICQARFRSIGAVFVSDTVVYIRTVVASRKLRFWDGKGDTAFTFQ